MSSDEPSSSVDLAMHSRFGIAWLTFALSGGTVLLLVARARGIVDLRFVSTIILQRSRSAAGSLLADDGHHSRVAGEQVLACDIGDRNYRGMLESPLRRDCVELLRYIRRTPNDG